jgi:hypothetical protein
VKIKTSELTGPALDWAVAKCDQPKWSDEDARLWVQDDKYQYNPSTDWSQGGPIIERELIQLSPQIHGKYSGLWAGNKWHTNKRGVDVPGTVYGETPLVAAMRCYVASKLGDEVDVPEELK